MEIPINQTSSTNFIIVKSNGFQWHLAELSTIDQLWNYDNIMTNVLHSGGDLAFLRLLFSFWPIIVIAGWLPGWFGFNRFRPPLQVWLTRVFIAWVFWAIPGTILAVNRIPSLLIPEPLNSVIFMVFGTVLGFGLAFPSIRRVHLNRKLIRQAHEIEDLQILPPQHFESLISAFFEQYGFRTEKVGRSGDHGIDLVVFNKLGEKWIVQWKRWRGSIGEPVLRDLYGSMYHENAERGFLMTTGTFTQAAYKWAVGKPITLYDGPGMIRLLRRVQRHMRV